MIVCSCRRVAERDVRASALSGASTVDEVSRHCGAASRCGGCRPSVEAILSEVRVALAGMAESSPAPLAGVPVAAA